MSDWQIGDYALCIGEDLEGDATWEWSTVVGQCYTVSGIYDCSDWEGLDFLEDPAPNDEYCFDAKYYIKITPDKADEYDREVIEIMRGKKVDA